MYIIDLQAKDVREYLTTLAIGANPYPKIGENKYKILLEHGCVKLNKFNNAEITEYGLFLVRRLREKAQKSLVARIEQFFNQWKYNT